MLRCCCLVVVYCIKLTTPPTQQQQLSYDSDTSLQQQQHNDQHHQLQQQHHHYHHQPDQAIEWLPIYRVLLARFLLGAGVLVYRSDNTVTSTLRYSLSHSQLGLITSLSSLLGTVTAFWAGPLSDYYNNNARLLLCHAARLQLLSLLLLCVSCNALLLAVGQCVLAVACAVGRVTAVQLTLDLAPRHYTGQLIGLGATVLSVARMLAPTVSGLTLELHVAGPVMAATVLTAAGSLLLDFTGTKRLKTL